MYHLQNFESRDDLATYLATQIADILLQSIRATGRASLAVSGGSTPIGLFKALSIKDISWGLVTVTLVDERWVDLTDQASNTQLVHKYLLQNKAANAGFFHLKRPGRLTAQLLDTLNESVLDKLLPFDVVILGMGDDGHTASLFPCSNEIQRGLSKDSAPLLSVMPKTAPYQRISFSYNYLKQSKHLFLHICGQAKKETLTKAIANTDHEKMPISAFLHDPDLQTDIFWAE